MPNKEGDDLPDLFRDTCQLHGWCFREADVVDESSLEKFLSQNAPGVFGLTAVPWSVQTYSSKSSGNSIVICAESAQDFLVIDPHQHGHRAAFLARTASAKALAMAFYDPVGILSIMGCWRSTMWVCSMTHQRCFALDESEASQENKAKNRQDTSKSSAPSTPEGNVTLTSVSYNYKDLFGSDTTQSTGRSSTQQADFDFVDYGDDSSIDSDREAMLFWTSLDEESSTADGMQSRCALRYNNALSQEGLDAKQSSPEPMPRKPLRFNPPPPASSRGFCAAVVRDHMNSGLLGAPLKPKVARLSERADNETLAQFVQDGSERGARREDILMWLCLLHKSYRRRPVATVQQVLNDTSWVCSQERAAAMADMLSQRFVEQETTFDINRPGVGGIRAFKRLVEQFDILERHVTEVCKLSADQWTLTSLCGCLGDFKSVLSDSAPYLRGHHLRTLSLMAPLFGATGVPNVTMTCWDLLMTLFKTTSGEAKSVGLLSFAAAQAAVAYINAELETKAPHALTQYGRFTLLDLSCALCLVGGSKATYHKDEGLPYEVVQASAEANYRKRQKDAACPPAKRRRQQPAKTQAPLAQRGQMLLSLRAKGTRPGGKPLRSAPAALVAASAPASCSIKKTGLAHVIAEEGEAAVKCSVCGRSLLRKHRSTLANDADCLGRPESSRHYRYRARAIKTGDWAVALLMACCKGLPGDRVQCTSSKCMDE